MFEQYYDKLADLLLFAVNFTEGDKIHVTIDFDCREVAHRLAQRAYQRGARYVGLDYRDEFLQAAAIAGSCEEFWFPEYLQHRQRETTGPGWKSISIRSQAEGDIFEDLAVERSTAYMRAQRKNGELRMKAIMSNSIPWTVTVLPSLYLARRAFPTLSPEEGLRRYRETIVTIMHLDADDPRTVWHEKMAADGRRSRFMNELRPAALRFHGPGTDLTVGLNRHAEWIGGYDHTTTGEPFISNVPTEEIFTSPDFRRVEGRVRLTRPLMLHENLGPVPLDAWFEFHEGRVVDYGATQGRETLSAFFDLDERAVYLGEIALVDPASSIAATGMTYYNTLHDENSACHMAFGKAYPFTLRERRDYSDEELLELGMNVATVHEDVMIGGPEVDLTAILRDGSRREIISGGKLVI